MVTQSQRCIEPEQLAEHPDVKRLGLRVYGDTDVDVGSTALDWSALAGYDHIRQVSHHQCMPEHTHTHTQHTGASVLEALARTACCNVLVLSSAGPVVQLC